MLKIFLVLVVLEKGFVNCNLDLTPEAITVYRNPEFFKNLNYATNVNYKQKSRNLQEPGSRENYKQPAETKNPNPPPPSPGFEINYDNSPEFHHEPRDLFLDKTYKPNRRKIHGSRYHGENNLEETTKLPKPTKEESKEEESKGENKSFQENKGFLENKGNEDGLGDFSSILNGNPDDEFSLYHDPILAKEDFNPNTSSGFVSSVYSQPYAYNRSTPVLYEDWKFYTYPKIYSKEFLKSDFSPVYSEEPSSNVFKVDESSSYSGYDDESEESTNLFEDGDYKNLGADTKHIYKKLLNPKKFLPSIWFKFNSNPKFKKLKLKVKKGHFHGGDWFNQYPFNF